MLEISLKASGCRKVKTLEEPGHSTVWSQVTGHRPCMGEYLTVGERGREYCLSYVLNMVPSKGTMIDIVGSDYTEVQA